MLTSILLLVAGLAALALGAEALVRGSVAIAERLQVPKIIIGLTVVALGTSAPELITSLHAALSGEPGIVLGNAVGSNIANLGLVLGIGTLISRHKIIVTRQFSSRDVVLMLIVTVLCFLLAWDGLVGRIDGLVLLLFLIPLTFFAVKNGPDETEAIPEVQLKGGVLAEAALLTIGLASLAFGARWLVGGAVGLAEAAGVSDTLIGATVVAFGTSAPEMAATISAVIRRQHGIMLGNIIGSCQLNLALIIGVPALITPLQVDQVMEMFHLPALLIVSLVSWYALKREDRVRKREGIIMLLLYFAYIAAGIYIDRLAVH